MNWITQPWPWYIGGPIIGIIMLVLILLGKDFGVSSNFRTICSAFGAGKTCSFFDINPKKQIWNLLFLLGALLGGMLAHQFLSNNQVPNISQETIKSLKEIGISSAGNAYAPIEIFNDLSLKNFIILLIGGILIGFGTRYAGGCTSGHAISGLSNLQTPSLIAVVGFFIGGLLMSHFILPLIF